MLAEASACQKRGWAVLPVWGVNGAGSCRCGKPHTKDPRQIGKHPLGVLAPHGVRSDARRGGDAGLVDASIPTRTWHSRRGRLDLLVPRRRRRGGTQEPPRPRARARNLPTTVSQLTAAAVNSASSATSRLKNAVKFAPGLNIRHRRSATHRPGKSAPHGRRCEWKTPRAPTTSRWQRRPDLATSTCCPSANGPEDDTRRAPR